MLKIGDYRQPASPEEAYEILNTTKSAVVLGGCAYLKLAGRKIDTAIDLSKLSLDRIVECGETLEIGSMVTLREIETHPLMCKLFSGLLSASVEHIVGVQLRNIVTIGGSVMGRYPFSDPITALVALDACLVFQNAGTVRLEEYLEGKGYKDILLKIIVDKNTKSAAYKSVRKSATDYAIINTAVAKNTTGYRIVVGARPGRSARAISAEKYLAENGISEASIKEAAKIAAEELKFGDNPRGSALYRKAVCPVLIERALKEVEDEA